MRRIARSRAALLGPYRLYGPLQDPNKTESNLHPAALKAIAKSQWLYCFKFPRQGPFSASAAADWGGTAQTARPRPAFFAAPLPIIRRRFVSWSLNVPHWPIVCAGEMSVG